MPESKSTPVARPFRCAECGELVRVARSRPDMHWWLDPGLSVPLPDDVLLPSCECGEYYVTGSLVTEIEAKLRQRYAAPNPKGPCHSE